MLNLSSVDALSDGTLAAVGAGWLLRGLLELLPREVGRTVEWCGNDILPAAIDAAFRALGEIA